MAPKSNKVHMFARKSEKPYYDGPDLLDTSASSASRKPKASKKKPEKYDQRKGDYWALLLNEEPSRSLDQGGHSASASKRSPSLSSSNNSRTLSAIPVNPSSEPGQNSYRPNRSTTGGRKPPTRVTTIEAFKESPSPSEESSSSQPSPPIQPLSPRRRAQWLDLLEATSRSSDHSNSSLSNTTPRTSHFNEEVADRNGSEAGAIDGKGHNPQPSLEKYQEHVASRNLDIEVGPNATNGIVASEKHEAPIQIVDGADIARLGASVAAEALSCHPSGGGTAPRPVSRSSRSFESANMNGLVASIGRSSSINPAQSPRSNLIKRPIETIPGSMNEISRENQSSVPSAAPSGVAMPVSAKHAGIDQRYVPEPTPDTWRRPARRVLDLTDDDNLVEIMEHPMKPAYRTSINQEEPQYQETIQAISHKPTRSTYYALPHGDSGERPEGTLLARLNDKGQLRSSESGSVIELPLPTPTTNYSSDEDDYLLGAEHAPSHRVSWSSAPKENIHRDLLRRKSAETLKSLSKQHASTFPRKEYFRSSERRGVQEPAQEQEDIAEPPSIPTLRESSSPLRSSNAKRRTRSGTAPSHQESSASYIDFQPQLQKPESSMSTWRPGTSMSNRSTARSLQATPTSSLRRDNTLLISGLDGSQLAKGDDFTLIDDGSPGLSSSQLDNMIDSFSLDESPKKTFAVPPYRIPKRGSSLNAVIEGDDSFEGFDSP